MKFSAKSWLTIATVSVSVAGLSAEAFAHPGMGQAPAAASNVAEQALVASPSSSSISGKVLETANGGGYTYVYLEEKSGNKVWVAVPEMKVKVGDHLDLLPGSQMGKFSSRTLKRTFDSIIFSAGPVSSGGAVDAEAVKRKAHEGIVSSKKISNSAGEVIKVARAKGHNAFTVAELYGKTSALAGQKVLVRGKVVKVSAGIMGKNWIHLQDGSGNAAQGTHELLLTSQDMPKVGDVVTFAGTLYKDKDFGSGYKYKAIIEDAVIKH